MWWHWKVISSSRCSLYSGNSGHIKKTQRYSACLPCANTWFDPQHLKKHVGVSLFLWEATGRRWLSTHQEESCSPEPNGWHPDHGCLGSRIEEINFCHLSITISDILWHQLKLTVTVPSSTWYSCLDLCVVRTTAKRWKYASLFH